MVGGRWKGEWGCKSFPQSISLMGRESIIQERIEAARVFSCSTTYKEYLAKNIVRCCAGPGLKVVKNASASTCLFSTQRCPVDMAPGRNPQGGRQHTRRREAPGNPTRRLNSPATRQSCFQRTDIIFNVMSIKNSCLCLSNHICGLLNAEKSTDVHKPEN